MPHRRLRGRLFPVLCALFLALPACSKSPVVDERLTGAWHASLGHWSVTFEADAEGRYRTTFRGPSAPPAETGEIEARDGKWQVRKDSGEDDDGTYYFVSDDTLVMQGGKGALTWQRGPATAAPPPLAATPPPRPVARLPQTSTALQGDWPLRDLPAIAQNAGNAALEWQPDAILIGIDAELLQKNSPVLHNVETPAGRVTLTLKFCSPGKQQSIVIRPAADGGGPMGENPFDCRSDQAIATGFMGLPEAVVIARERGMKAELPKRASLENRTSGAPGEDIFGVAWQIFSTDRRDQSYLIPTQPQAAATVRAVDPCRLITAQDAESALGAAVHKVPPHYDEPNTWSCIYQVGDDQQQRLSLKVDESPAVDSRGYMANQRRNRRKSISGLGDEAYVFDSPAGFATLDVRLGDTLLKFGLGDPASGREQTITRLAHQAVGRMVAGEGILAEASPDAKLTGKWTATHNNRKLLLVVRPDKALTLSVAESQNGVLTTDSDRWEVLDRARRPQDAGTWEWSGPDEFRTGGDIVATWRRVPHGSAPENIARPLTAGTGIESDTVTDSGQWPHMPLDEKLAGLWRGEGQIGQQGVDLAWRIRPEGPSTQIWTATGKGYVENVDRSQRIILKFSGELERIGRQAKLDFHDGAVVTGFPDDDHMVMQLHNLKRLEWTRAGTPSIARPDVPGSGALPRGGGAVETVESAIPSSPPEPGTMEAAPVQGASDAEPVDVDQASRAERDSVKEKAAKVGRKTVDIVEDAADTVGDFIEGIFSGQSSEGKPDASRSSGREFEPQDW